MASYNAADELTGITDTVGGQPLWSFGYGRNGIGQVGSASDPLDGQQHTYSYDALDRLTDDQSASDTASWSYDAANRLTQLTDSTNSTDGYTTTLSYDNADEVTGVQTVQGQGGTPTQNATLTYNGDGDRTGQSDSVSGTSTSYGYDQADRLTTATITATGGITQASYSYDGDGLRQAKTISGTTERFTWDTAGSLPLLMQDGGTRYVYGPDGLPVEQIDAQGHVLYDYHDQLGSTRGLLDGSGAVVATYSYGPFGGRTAISGTVTMPFGYAGQYTDAETGLQYLRARYYDPATAQFLSVDPLVAQTGQPYAYAIDDPLNATDPSGLDCSLGDAIRLKCRLPTWQETRVIVYHAAERQAGFFDSLSRGGFTWFADLLGAHANRCSYDYLAGRYGPEVAAGLVRPSGGAPDFVVDPNGNVIPVPNGATGPSPVRTGKGFQYNGGFGGPGLNGRVSNVRIMDPTPRYPGGYVNYSNQQSQAINPYTGRTIPPADPMWHQPIDLNPPPPVVVP